MKANKAPEKIWINPPMDLPKLNGVIDKDSVEYIRKDALVKYLFEEKGYPITLNGELLHWDELNKHLAEYNKWKKDDFIKKALKFLDGSIPDYIELKHTNVDTFMDVDNERFIKDFKNYMEG